MFDCTRGRFSHQWSFTAVYDNGQLGYTCDYCGRIKMEEAPKSTPAEVDPDMEYIVTDLETGDQRIVLGRDVDKPPVEGAPIEPVGGEFTGWSGYTDDVIQFGEVYEGSLAFRIQGRAGIHFCVWSLAPDLSHRELVVNTTSGFDGTVLIGTQGPVAGFQVTSSGPWTVEWLDGLAIPVLGDVVTGANDAVFALAPQLGLLDHPVVLHVQTQTDGRSTLWGYGQAVSLLVNDVSPFGYSGTVIVPAGTQLLALSCDGGWRLAKK